MDTTADVTAPSWSADPAHPLTVAAGYYPPASLPLLRSEFASLDRLLHRHPPPAALDRYLAAVDSFDQRCDRWAVAVAASRSGSLALALPARPAWTPPSVTKRPLRDLELGLTRWTASRCPVRATAVALFEAGTASGEAHRVVGELLAREPDGERWQVALPGDPGTGVQPRRVTLADWATDPVGVVLASLPEGVPLIYSGRSEDPGKRQSAVLMRARQTLRDAGLTADPTVKPESLRNTGARHAYEAAELGQGLQAAAAVLGLDDLDRVARRIGLAAKAAAIPSTLWSSR